ncbi:MAG: diguanylate cyclase [Acidimicrobiia bacterium]
MPEQNEPPGPPALPPAPRPAGPVRADRADGRWRAGPWRAGLDRALLRTVTLAAALVLGALVGLAHLSGPRTLPAGGDGAPWWPFAVGFAVSGLVVFSLQTRRERTTFTFAEVPLILGLFWAGPVAVVAARLTGESAVLLLHDRPVPRKLVLNLASFAAETVAAYTAFDAVRGDATVTEVRSWVAALVAAGAADAVSMLAVTLAKRFHGAPIGLASLVRTNVITLCSSTALALTAGLLLHEHPVGLVPFFVVVALVLLAWRSYGGLIGQLDSLNLLYEFTRLAAGSRRSDEIVAPQLARLRELLAADYAAVHLFGVEGEQAEHWFDAEEATLRPLPVDLAEQTRRFEQAQRRPRPTGPDRHRGLAVVLGRPGGLARALLAPGGEVIGALVVDTHRVDLGPFGHDDAKLFNELADHIGAALDNAKLIDRLREENRQRTHEARHDELTGLSNRAEFNRRIEAEIGLARRNARVVGVGLMDLNRFKQVNDTLGHHVGDLLLVAVAERVRAVLSPDELLARLGGDEFALLVVGDVKVAALHELGERIAAAVREPFELDGSTIRIGTSIGFSRFPVDGTDATTVLREADAAMYRAKQRPDGPRVEVVTRDRLTMEL